MRLGEALLISAPNALNFTTYRPQEPLGPADSPMDLFEGLCLEPESHHLSHHRGGADEKAKRHQAFGWRSQRESNPCFGLERATS